MELEHMPVTLGLWTEMSLHMGHALITTILLGLFMSLRNAQTGELSNTDRWVIRFSAMAAIVAICSSITEVLLSAHPSLSFVSSDAYWAVLTGMSVLFAAWNGHVLKKWHFHQEEALNALSQEQLLHQSVAQLQRNIDLRDQVQYAKRMNLRTQMNPHFLFNVLTGIQHLIFKEDNERAGLVFRRFRILLMQGFMSHNRIVGSLKEELQHIQDYLELEAIRLPHAITWNITLSHEIKAELTPFPLFLLQPLVENAIWHGLSEPSIINPQLQIEILWQEESLIASVHDNGKGLTQTKRQKGHQSRGTAIVKERMTLLRHPGKFELLTMGAKGPFQSGTTARLILPLWALEPPPVIIMTGAKTGSSD